jgi:hypothetical protein
MSGVKLLLWGGAGSGADVKREAYAPFVATSAYHDRVHVVDDLCQQVKEVLVRLDKENMSASWMVVTVSSSDEATAIAEAGALAETLRHKCVGGDPGVVVSSRAHVDGAKAYMPRVAYLVARVPRVDPDGSSNSSRGSAEHPAEAAMLKVVHIFHEAFGERVLCTELMWLLSPPDDRHGRVHQVCELLCGLVCFWVLLCFFSGWCVLCVFVCFVCVCVCVCRAASH